MKRGRLPVAAGQLRAEFDGGGPLDGETAWLAELPSRLRYRGAAATPSNEPVVHLYALDRFGELWGEYLYLGME